MQIINSMKLFNRVTCYCMSSKQITSSNILNYSTNQMEYNHSVRLCHSDVTTTQYICTVCLSPKTNCLLLWILFSIGCLIAYYIMSSNYRRVIIIIRMPITAYGVYWCFKRVLNVFLLYA